MGDNGNMRHIQTLTSLKDEKIQQAKRLNTAKERIALKQFLVEGVEAIRWALDAEVELLYVLGSPKVPIPDDILSRVEAFHVSEGLLKKVTGTSYLIPVVAVGTVSERQTCSPFEVVLDGVHDAGNIGTIIRTCHAFGIDSVLSTTPDCDLFQRKTVNASRGTIFSTVCQRFDSPEHTLDYLRRHQYYIVTTSPYGEQLQSLAELPEQHLALIIGNETHGVSEVLLHHANVRVQIPMQPHVESLNVGVATGISLYELKLKQIIGMIEKKIKSTLGRDMNVVAMLMHEALNKALKEVSSFSSRQVVFLMVLQCDVVMETRELQQQFGLPDEDVESSLSPLLEKQLIRKPTESSYTMTPTGIETLGKLWAVVEKTEQQILHGFSDEETTTLRAWLSRLQKNCVEIIHA